MHALPLGSALLVLALFAGAGAKANSCEPESREPALNALAGALRTATPIASSTLSLEEAERFMRDLAMREACFYQEGVGFDAKTGLSYDGQDLDFDTGKRTGARTFGAASKEFLHLSLLSKALQGDPTASVLVSPNAPSQAPKIAAALLAKKVATYERFDREFPGYGGFLPWYRVEDGRIVPTDDWQDRVPGLDNGQLAWALYHAAGVLQEQGQPELAARYRARVERMAKNVVRVFYDPAEGKLRAEAGILGGNRTPAASNRYANHVAGYFLDDAYEGLMLNHFADLFGDWSRSPRGKNALWDSPRRKPATFDAPGGKITVVRGHWSSSHEEWAFLALPFRDLPLADRLFVNGQKARATYSAMNGFPGLFASTHQPVTRNAKLEYVSALGIPSISKLPSASTEIYAPYAAFPLALADKAVFASWLKNMLDAPKALSPCGMVDSFGPGGAIAPVLTWDGKALPMLAWTGGTSDDVRRFLVRDGLYDAFFARVKADYAAFDEVPIEGESLPLPGPTAAAGVGAP